MLYNEISVFFPLPLQDAFFQETGNKESEGGNNFPITYLFAYCT